MTYYKIPAGTKTFGKIMEEIEKYEKVLDEGHQYIAEITGLKYDEDVAAIWWSKGYDLIGISGICILKDDVQLDNNLWRLTKEKYYHNTFKKFINYYKPNRRSKKGKELYEKLDSFKFEPNELYNLLGFSILSGYMIHRTEKYIAVHFKGDPMNNSGLNMPDDAIEITASEFKALAEEN